LYRTGPVAALALALLLALASCGGGSGNGGTTPTAPAAAETVTAAGGGQTGSEANPPAAGDPRAGGGATPPSSPAGKGGCEARLGDFLDRMDDLRQSLLAGLSYDEYVVRVQAIRAAYEAVPVAKLGAGCVTGPAAAAEAAFNQYLRAANAWGECAATAGCAASEVEGKLQHRWHLASKSLEAAGRPS
jgi:hypothetical protein